MHKDRVFIFGLLSLVLAYSQHAKTATSSSTAQSISAVAVTTTTTPKVQTSRPTSVLPVGPTTTTLAQITVARTASTIAQTSIAVSIIAQTSRTASTIVPQSATVALTTTNLASIPATTAAVTSPRPMTNAGVPTTLRTNFVSTTNSISVTTTRISTTANAGLPYCASNPCQNGGTCTENANTYTCDCVPGFSNYSCEIDINECETLPCYPFGNCTDKINDYSCSCNAGFTPGNTNKQCTNIDECLTKNVVCQNGGTCQDYINAFQCQCPLAADGTSKYYGEFCDKPTTRIPQITGISKAVGILSGGAAITFYGADLDQLPPFGVNFTDATGQHKPLFGYVKANSTQPTSFVALTPKADESLIGVDLMLVVIYSGGFAQNLPLKFQYVGNPQVVDITPKVTLAKGGIQLTVMGNNLDAIGTAIMTVNLELSYPNGTITTQTYAQICSVANNAFEMNCQLPNFDLASTFFEASPTNKTLAKNRRRREIPSAAFHLYRSLRNIFVSIYTVAFGDERPATSPFKKLKRRRRDPVASLNASDGSIAKLYLGFIFDNYPKYDNISKSLPNVTFTLINDGPKFPAADNKQTQIFDPDKQEPLQIKGWNMTRGCSKNDYNVSVGGGVCNVTALTDNVLTCTPPVEKPPVNDDTFKYCPLHSSHLAVMVRVSTYVNFAFCVQYTDGGDSWNWVIGVCVGCGCGLLILLLIVVVSVRIHGSMRKRKSGTTRSRSDSPPEPRRMYGRQRGRSEMKDHLGSFPTRDANGVEMRSYRSGRSRGFGIAPFLAFAKRISYTRQAPQKDGDYNDYDAQIPENDNPIGRAVRPELRKQHPSPLREHHVENELQGGAHKWQYNYPNVDSRDSNLSIDYSNPDEFSNNRHQYDRRLPKQPR